MDALAVDLKIFGDLANLPIGEFRPKPNSVEGEQREASRQLWASADGGTRVGIWECTPGRFTSERPTSSEICHIILGRAEVRSNHGEFRMIGPGDLLVLPKGWCGEWRILENLRKFYTVHTEAATGQNHSVAS